MPKITAKRIALSNTDIIDVWEKSPNKKDNITSESFPNAYSVSYKSNDNATMMSEINALLQLYLGDRYSAVGIVKIIN